MAQLILSEFELLILIIIKNEPSYGYKIMQHPLIKMSQPAPSRSTIYTALQKLTTHKMVKSKLSYQVKTPARKFFSLSAKGQYYLLQHGTSYIAEEMVSQKEIIQYHIEKNAYLRVLQENIKMYHPFGNRPHTRF